MAPRIKHREKNWVNFNKPSCYAWPSRTEQQFVQTFKCKENKLFPLQDIFSILFPIVKYCTQPLNVLESNLIMSIRWPCLRYLLMRLDKSELKRTLLVMEWVKSWAGCQAPRDSSALMPQSHLYLSLLPSLRDGTGRRRRKAKGWTLTWTLFTLKLKCAHCFL